jgi:hypothetical protein
MDFVKCNVRLLSIPDAMNTLAESNQKMYQTYCSTGPSDGKKVPEN